METALPILLYFGFAILVAIFIRLVMIDRSIRASWKPAMVMAEDNGDPLFEAMLDQAMKRDRREGFNTNPPPTHNRPPYPPAPPRNVLNIKVTEDDYEKLKDEHRQMLSLLKRAASVLAEADYAVKSSATQDIYSQYGHLRNSIVWVIKNLDPAHYGMKRQSK